MRSIDENLKCEQILILSQQTIRFKFYEAQVEGFETK